MIHFYHELLGFEIIEAFNDHDSTRFDYECLWGGACRDGGLPGVLPAQTDCDGWAWCAWRSIDPATAVAVDALHSL